MVHFLQTTPGTLVAILASEIACECAIVVHWPVPKKVFLFKVGLHSPSLPNLRPHNNLHQFKPKRPIHGPAKTKTQFKTKPQRVQAEYRHGPRILSLRPLGNIPSSP